MNSLLLMVISFFGYIISYKLYGKYLSKKIFKLNNEVLTPSVKINDGKDFVPTKKEILFGHHFTSIAGLGPIVGPAIAVIWGWLPAVLWILFGAIFMGAIHDFGALILSVRNKGRSIGDIAANLISQRIKNMFLGIMFIANLMVITVFTLIVAILFDMYPSAVIPIWLEIPIAIILGYVIYKKKGNHTLWAIIAIILLFVFVVVGTYFPIILPEIMGLHPLVIWAFALLIYAYIASILPVTTLLQPRDYINSHQLILLLFLLVISVFWIHPDIVAPAILSEPEGAPSMIPFLFIVIACGAISGFHSLISGGTTSKQCEKESDTFSIGFGGMLAEGFLSIMVVIAVTAGLGLGLHSLGGEVLTGKLAFSTHYATWSSASGLGAKLKAFVEGSANLMSGLGIPTNISMTLMGVFLVSFAATTLDSATRVQRYIVNEVAENYNIKSFTKPHLSTLLVVGIVFLMCFNGGFSETALKKGALTLWPLFGVTNQVLATLTLFVVTVYLARNKVNIIFSAIPAIVMALITIWSSILTTEIFISESNYLLIVISLIAFLIEIWIIIESILILTKIYKRNT